jgi:hypothetical protein
MTAELRAAILAEGLDDWVPLLTVHFVAEKLWPAVDEAQIRERITSTIQGLIEQRLVEIGTVSDAGFSSWNIESDVVRERLLEAFATEDENTWGFAAWLNNTPAGDAFANHAESVKNGA